MFMFYNEIKYDIDYSRKNQLWNGWGSYDHDLIIANKIPDILELLKDELKLKRNIFERTPSVTIDDLKVPRSSLRQADLKSLEAACGKANVYTNKNERVFHSAGQSYYDLIRLRTNQLKHYCDGVCYPQNKNHVKRVLTWAAKNKISIVPFGGGSSVVGGLEIIKGKKNRAVVVMDMTAMKKLIAFDEYSRVATFEAGIYGPEIEKILNKKGCTLGHFPQSFEYSTIGGWVAARSAGQQSNHYGKIEEILTCVEMVSPVGEIKTLKVPAGAMGPDINQVVAGSEGLLGIITEVSVKVHELPEDRNYFGALFSDLKTSVDFQRHLSGTSMDMSMVRISDDSETRLLQMLGGLGKNGILNKIKSRLMKVYLNWKGMKSGRCLVMCGMDGDKEILERQEIIVRSLIQKYDGLFIGYKPGQNWIKGRFNMPFLRNHIMDYGIAADTLETAVSWSNVLKVHTGVLKALRSSTTRAVAMCHLSHSYHDGACLYFTILFDLDQKNPIAQWKKIKSAASDAIIMNGGNMSHHHGIGADHKQWYEKQTSSTELGLLRAMKANLDPKSILNPGKLFDK